MGEPLTFKIDVVSAGDIMDCLEMSLKQTEASERFAKLLRETLKEVAAAQGVMDAATLDKKTVQ